MSRIERIGRMVALVALFVVSVFVAPAVASAQTKSYTSTTIRGRLVDPATNKPMSNATVRFTDEGDAVFEGRTNDAGEFSVSGLPYASYLIEIETAAGETIKGINSLPLAPGEAVEIRMRISDRVVSKTLVENEPERFLAVVKKDPFLKKKFWKQFGIFLGVSAGVAVAAD